MMTSSLHRHSAADQHQQSCRDKGEYTHAWLAQRPLPDPEREADLLALCGDDERRDSAFAGFNSQAYLDSLQPVQYAAYPPPTAAVHTASYGPAHGLHGTVQTCYIAGNAHLYESPGASDRTDLV